MDRLDMLKQLTKIKDGHDILDKYILNHYAEIYSLYNLFLDCNIKYKNIKFIKLIEDDGFSIVCDMNDDDYNSLCEYCKNNDNKIEKYTYQRLEENSYFDLTVELNNNSSAVITFK